MSVYVDEVNKLRLTISVLDRDKDSLQAEVDEKAERLVLMEEELLLKVTSTGSLIKIKSTKKSKKVLQKKYCQKIKGKWLK